MGLAGTCREEYTKMNIDDREDKGTLLGVKIRNSETNIEKNFVLVGNYLSLRPPNTT